MTCFDLSVGPSVRPYPATVCRNHPLPSSVSRSWFSKGWSKGGMNQEFRVEHVERALPGPGIYLIPIDALVLCLEVGPWASNVGQPFIGQDGEVRVAHDTLTKTFDTVIWCSLVDVWSWWWESSTSMIDEWYVSCVKGVVIFVNDLPDILLERVI